MQWKFSLKKKPDIVEVATPKWRSCSFIINFSFCSWNTFCNTGWVTRYNWTDPSPPSSQPWMWSIHSIWNLDLVSCAVTSPFSLYRSQISWLGVDELCKCLQEPLIMQYWLLSFYFKLNNLWTVQKKTKPINLWLIRLMYWCDPPLGLKFSVAVCAGYVNSVLALPEYLVAREKINLEIFCNYLLLCNCPVYMNIPK